MGRWFTPSDSDQQSGEQYNAMYNAMQPTPMPEAPKVDNESEKAEKAKRDKLRASASSKSVFTSPLGLSGAANIIKKSLLGQ